MGKFITIFFLIISLVLPAGFISAQTATPTPTPTPTQSPNRGFIPVGTVLAYTYDGSTTLPEGWLVCNGALLSRTTYAELFSIIGTTYGAGDGSTTFKLPDLGGRNILGAGGPVGGTPIGPGSTGGEQVHTITITEMPPHTHTEFESSTSNPGIYLGGSGGTHRLVGGSLGTASNTQVTTGSTGGGAAMNVLDPYVGIPYIIYTGVALDISDVGSEGSMSGTPDGATIYTTAVIGGEGQPVALRYEVRPGDVIISGLLFVIVALIMTQMWLNARRERAARERPGG